MFAHLEPVLATVAAAVVGVLGPTGPLPPPNTSVTCLSWPAGQDPDRAVLDQRIRALAAELSATAGTSSDPRPALATEAIARAGLGDGTDCRPSAGGRSSLPGADIARAAAGLATSIVDALAAAGVFTPRSIARADPPDQDGSTENNHDKNKRDENKHENTQDDNTADDRHRGGDGAAENDDDTAGGNDDRRPPPATPPPPKRPPTDPRPTDPGPHDPAPPDSPVTTVEKLIRDLSSTLRSSSDPAMRRLGDELLDVLRDGPGTPGRSEPGGRSDRTSVLPNGVTTLFSDDFEGGDLSQWGSCQGAGVNGDCAGIDISQGMGVGQDPERGNVAQFRVQDGKTAEIGGERSEVRDDDPEMVTNEGDERWYSWSMKFPADFPEPDGGYYIVMQWHQTSDSGSPPLMIDISKGTVDIGGDGSDGPRQTIGQIHRGEWVDYVLHAGFSPSDGFVEAWENGQQTVEKTARATMSDAENYLKMGIYRDEDATGDAEVWFDDFSIHDGAAATSAPRRERPGRGSDSGSGEEGGDRVEAARR